MLNDFVQYSDGTSRPKTKADYLEDQLELERTHYYYKGKWYLHSDYGTIVP